MCTFDSSKSQHKGNINLGALISKSKKKNEEQRIKKLKKEWHRKKEKRRKRVVNCDVKLCQSKFLIYRLASHCNLV